VSSDILLQGQGVTVSLPRSPWRRVFESPAAPAALLAVFTLLCMSTIGRFSTWIDESFSLVLVGANNYVDIVRLGAADVHPPLWYLVFKPWLQVFGTGLVAARAESVVFMVAAFAVWYHFVRTRFSRPLALLVLALMATNPMLLHYAVEARMYALAVLLVSLSCVFITSTAGWRWFAYWPCAVAMLYTHYFLVFPVVAQFIYLLVRRRELGLSILWIVLYGGSMLAAFGPWLPIAFHRTVSIVTTYFWIGPIAPSSITAYVTYAFLHRQDADLQSGYVFPALLFLTVWAASLIRAGRVRHGLNTLLWCMVGVPWLCLFVLSCKPLVPVFHPRYVLFGLPALITLLATGVLGFERRWKAIAAVVLIAGGLWGLQLLRWRGFSDTQGYWSMKQLAKTVAKPIDGEKPWIVTDEIFCFADARATLKPTQRVVIFLPEKPAFVTPHILYYDRPDWYILSLTDIQTRHAWTIQKQGGTEIAMPAGWKLVKTLDLGYAHARLFRHDTP